MGELFPTSQAIGEDYYFDAVDFVNMPDHIRTAAQRTLWSVMATAHLGASAHANACVVLVNPKCGFIVTVWDNTEGGFIAPTTWHRWHGLAFEDFATRIRHAIPPSVPLEWEN